MCPCTYLLTYLHSWLCAYKTVHISKTVEHSAKFTMNGLHKIVRWLSIVAKMHDFKWPLRASFKVIDSLNSTKMTKYSLVVTPTPWRVAAWRHYLFGPTYSCVRALTHLLTYLHWITSVFGRLAVDMKFPIHIHIHIHRFLNVHSMQKWMQPASWQIITGKFAWISMDISISIDAYPVYM